jgi:hypothetical protein
MGAVVLKQPIFNRKKGSQGNTSPAKFSACKGKCLKVSSSELENWKVVLREVIFYRGNLSLMLYVASKVN